MELESAVIARKDTNKRHQLLRRTVAVILLLITLYLLGLWWKMSDDAVNSLNTNARGTSSESVSPDWVKGYIATHTLPKTLNQNPMMDSWLDGRIQSWVGAHRSDIAGIVSISNQGDVSRYNSAVGGNGVSRSGGAGQASSSSNQQPNNVTNVTQVTNEGVTYAAGNGVTIANSVISTKLGTSVGADELEDGAVTLNTLNISGCVDGEIPKIIAGSWQCGADTSESAINNPAAVGQLAYFTSGSSLDGSYLYQELSGLRIGQGKNLQVEGTLSGNGSGLTNLNGGQLNAGSVSNVVLANNSVDGSKLASGSVTSAKIANSAVTSQTILDGSITANDIADGGISLSKLNDSECANGEVIKKTAGSWACGSDDEGQQNVYTAGSGLRESGGAFSLDTSSANNWMAAQTFSSGFVMNGALTTNLAGSGLALNGGVLSSVLGTSIDSTELSNGAVSSGKLQDGSVTNTKISNGAVTGDKIANGAITLVALGQNGCTSGEIIKWNGSAWACAADDSTDYSAGQGITKVGNTFSLNLASANNWSATQTFAGGMNVGGSTFTNLTGAGLQLSAGVLSTTLGTSIDNGELSDGSVGTTKIQDGNVTANKLATGAVTSTAIANNVITFDKIAQNGCTSGQVMKWNGTAWACATDLTGGSANAGNGLSQSGGTLSLDLASTNNWTGAQTFSGGINLGGNTYSNLAGTGLSFASGTLSSTLGSTIESSEITDGTIASADIAFGAVTSATIADGTIVGADIADGAITGAKIQDGTITAADLANSSVTGAKIADGSVTGAKLSAASKRKVVTANIGSISAALLSVDERPIFVAPTNGTITKVTFTTSSNVTVNVGKGSLSVQRKSATPATVATVDMATTAIAPYAPATPSPTAGTVFSAGDVYSYRYTPGTLGVAVDNLLVTIEYTVDD